MNIKNVNLRSLWLLFLFAVLSLSATACIMSMNEVSFSVVILGFAMIKFLLIISLLVYALRKRSDEARWFACFLDVLGLAGFAYVFALCTASFLGEWYLMPSNSALLNVEAKTIEETSVGLKYRRHENLVKLTNLEYFSTSKNGEEKSEQSGGLGTQVQESYEITGFVYWPDYQFVLDNLDSLKGIQNIKITALARDVVKSLHATGDLTAKNAEAMMCYKLQRYGLNVKNCNLRLLDLKVRHSKRTVTEMVSVTSGNAT